MELRHKCRELVRLSEMVKMHIKVKLTEAATLSGEIYITKQKLTDMMMDNADIDAILAGNCDGRNQLKHDIQRAGPAHHRHHL